MRTSSRKVLFPLAALSLSVIVSAILTEGVFKIMDVREKHARHQVVGRISRVSEIPGVRFEMLPNITSTTPGFKGEVRINNLGFRGEDVSVEKPPGTYRIAVLGDSITFGRYLSEKSVYPRLLEESMNSSGRYPRPVEVINASFSGRDTWEELALLEHRVMPLRPDLVVLEICLNDHVRFPLPEKGAAVGAFGDQAWWQYSSFLHYLDKRVKGFRQYHIEVLKKLGLYQPTGKEFLQDFYIDQREILDLTSNWEEWSEALLGIRDLARAGGSDVLFVLFPLSHHFKKLPDETAPLVSALAREHDIPFIDMLGPFLDAEGGGVYRDRLHPNSRGHRIVAEEIEKQIAARFLPPLSPKLGKEGENKVKMSRRRLNRRMPPS
jgi:lysophospholipase L1-like esterase